MGKKSTSDDTGDSNETSEATLAALTIQIREFVHEGTLDSRCAAKLVKRLKKEAEAISESGSATKTGQKELKKAFDLIDAALRDHDAGLLVTANAALRSVEDSTSARK
ncbi:hypothetical protein [Paraburkholderia aromaticivorans]|uniref:hypothetical protein n=1 Tax=Paraburkholderia aromaticivorans TaxID=2026199 RepID=UPI001455DDEB|nr:hypothetical protein [Paraburkholderia aromaticivorans]